MEQPGNRLSVAIFVLAGAGAGVLVAHLNGVTSWLDAKVFIAVGAFVGALLASALLKALRR